MKTVAILLIITRCIYIFTVKLAIFMVSLLGIVFACLFTQNMFRNNTPQNQQPRHGVRL
jgi:hypothetical protein